MLRGYYTEVMHLGVNVKKKIRALEGEKEVLKTGLGGVKNITLPERNNCKLIRSIFNDTYYTLRIIRNFVA